MAVIITTRNVVYVSKEGVCDGRRAIVMFPCEVGWTVRVVDVRPISQATLTADIAEAALSNSGEIIQGDDALLIGAIVPTDTHNCHRQHVHYFNVSHNGQRMCGYLSGLPRYFARGIFFRDEITITKHIVHNPLQERGDFFFCLNIQGVADVLTEQRTGRVSDIDDERALWIIINGNWHNRVRCWSSNGWSPSRKHIDAVRNITDKEGQYLYSLLLDRFDWAITDSDIKYALSTDNKTVIDGLASRPDLQMTDELASKLLAIVPERMAYRSDWTPTNEQAEQMIKDDVNDMVTVPLVLRLDWSPSSETIIRGLDQKMEIVRKAWQLRLGYIAWWRGRRQSDRCAEQGRV